ncbi:MAG: hypothetical protein GX841_05595 [Bacteroidales bacterium]|nr:hypothetical protein [Bacteroidales bacterium]
MKNEITKLIGYAERAIEEVNKELLKDEKNSQLIKIKNNLENVKKEAVSNAISGNYRGISRIILDSWDFTSKLGDLILNVDTLYKSLSK